MLNVPSPKGMWPPRICEEGREMRIHIDRNICGFALACHVVKTYVEVEYT